ncbi:hypothetical protein PROFUN_01967 [Planoprotostelium fungivorum]|uniref:Phosphatidylserine decarboxylase proenzyme 2 n=1 Tax=Planoprotostelium fungivorum TaxID=1890364 RepID=A0A2P6NB18_9EUKA|nr:hypothetical protein PROFUN_01967 [Planoprotostelium fungivorum]
MKIKKTTSKKDNVIAVPTASSTDPVVGLFSIKVMSATNIPKLDLIGHADPFVKIRFGKDIKMKTSVKKSTATPTWNENFKLLVLRSQQRYNISFEVFDWDPTSRNDLAGTAKVDLATFFDEEIASGPSLTPISKDFHLPLDHPGKAPGWGGQLHITVQYKGRQVVEREFWRGFAQHFDFDNSGTISGPELIAMVQALGSPATDAEILTLFTRADTNGDQSLSYEEFTNAMTSDLNSAVKNPILEKILPEDAVNFIWWAVAHDTHKNEGDGQSAIGALMLERGFYGRVEHRPQDDQAWKIVVCDRETGRLDDELIPDYIRVSLRLMYSYDSGFFASKINKVLKHLTEQQGRKFTNPRSKEEIQPFIKNYNLPINEILLPLDQFENFNEFFYRKLKPEARPIYNPHQGDSAVSPADCRMHVFPTITAATQMWIKGKNFNLKNLLQDSHLEKKYEGGSLVIARLAPQDYHRYHSPVTGRISKPVEHSGAYYTVNPIAIRTRLDVYTENRRTILEIQSEEFGDVCFIAVGATMVGSIVLTVKEGDVVQKGDEIGYFAFGGSTCLVLYQKGKIQYDEDLLNNSNKPLETLVKMGVSIGKVAA